MEITLSQVLYFYFKDSELCLKVKLNKGQFVILKCVVLFVQKKSVILQYCTL